MYSSQICRRHFYNNLPKCDFLILKVAAHVYSRLIFKKNVYKTSHKWLQHLARGRREVEECEVLPNKFCHMHTVKKKFKQQYITVNVYFEDLVIALILIAYFI